MVMDVIKFIWLLPATIIVWLFYVLPLWLITKDFVYVGRLPHSFIWTFHVVSKKSWYGRAWHRWLGWSGPCVYVFKWSGNKQIDWATRLHEVEHCKQQFRWGVFHYPAYFLCTLWILLTNRFRKVPLHAYLDNPFEKDARRAAGQWVEIPRDKWPDGPNDFNPWL